MHGLNAATLHLYVDFKTIVLKFEILNIVSGCLIDKENSSSLMTQWFGTVNNEPVLDNYPVLSCIYASVSLSDLKECIMIIDVSNFMNQSTACSNYCPCRQWRNHQSSWTRPIKHITWIAIIDGNGIPPILNPLHAGLFWRNMFASSIISHQWDGAGCWNPSTWKTMTSLSYMFNTMAADDLATQGARSSAAMILTHFSYDILSSAP